VIGSVLGHYRILDQIGAGGMGVVYRARDERLGRDVAIKVLPSGRLAGEEARRRFRKEARALSRLNHSHIEAIHDFDTQDGIDFIVLEYVPGDSLDRKLAQGPLPEREVIRLGTQLADGLAAAHRQGVLHQDLKPANLQITPDGLVKILDFGLASLMGTASDSVTTESKVEPELAGTLPYMAPERLQGKRADEQSDVYAAGAVLYEMVTGQRAFPHQGAALMAAILHSAPDSPSAVGVAVSPGLERIILKALAREPGERHASAEELKHELDAFQAGAASPSRPSLAHRSRTVLLLGLLLVVLTLGGYLLRERLAPDLEPTQERVTLAVLPFHVLTASDDIGFLALGIPDAVITRLSNIGAIHVRPTSAILRYAEPGVDTQRVGRELECDHVLTGTVQRTGDRFGVNVQLVQVTTGATLWGEHFDLPRSDLLGLQETLAESITAALRIEMTRAERARVERRYTENAAAYELYLQGRSQLVPYTESGTHVAISAFEQALQLDPDYALAHAGLAMASARMHLRFGRRDEVAMWRERAESEARLALKLAPELAEAHEALAAVYAQTEFEWERTIEECRKALELNPNLDGPHHQIGRAFYHLGLLDRTEDEVRAGLQVHPSNRVDALRNRGHAALYGGRYDDAVVAFEEVERLNGKPLSEPWLAFACFYAGQRERAERMLAELRHSNAAPTAARARAQLASFVAARGEEDQAHRLIDDAEAAGHMDHHVAYSLGVAHAQLEKPAEAVKWLTQATETGFPCSPWYERDPLLEPLRSDDAFQNLMGRLREAVSSARARYAPR
jgi:serine/threonine-protein kinase